MRDNKSAAALYKQMAFGEPSSDDTIVLSDQLKRLVSSSSDVKGYRQMAKIWLTMVGVSILLAIAGVLWVLQSAPKPTPAHSDSYYSSSSSEPTTDPSAIVLLIVKALLILIPLLFLIRFANRSYRINKHLEVVYAHRYALQQSLPEYLDAAGPHADRHQLMREILPFFYHDIETGYITKKDGLGDTGLDASALLKRLPKR